MNVREIHAHVPILEKDAELWLSVMDRALGDLGHLGPKTERLRATLRRVALMMERCKARENALLLVGNNAAEQVGKAFSTQPFTQITSKGVRMWGLLG
jgi:hypothetical protein